ncbi:MAG TPA: cysteine peptidase family C39 domain-containing protein [Candidatus Eisenbacteria bacterium]|nr:cysteine peptidase family C39 domain-containing protein [Candidatus Eisenbacteria bacterium]
MSGGVALALAVSLASPAAAPSSPAKSVESSWALPVPVIRQARERCGPAALQMVMRYYRADSAAEAQAEAAYDPVLRGALITELAAAARRAGFDAAVEKPGEDSLAAFLGQDVPPILLIDAGIGPLRKNHYVVLVGWDGQRSRVTILDGGSKPRSTGREGLMKRWSAAGGRALVVRRP